MINNDVLLGLPREILLDVLHYFSYAEATIIRRLSKAYKTIIDTDVLFQVKMLDEMPASLAMQNVNDFHLTSAYYFLKKKSEKTSLEVIYFALLTNNILQVNSQELQKAIMSTKNQLSIDLVRRLEITLLAIQSAEVNDKKEKKLIYEKIVEAIKKPEKRNRYINLAGACLIDIQLNEMDLSGINFSHANLVQACLKESNFENANLFCADLSEADLSFSELANVNLNRANLYKAYLPGANLGKANLTHANMESASCEFRMLPIFSNRRYHTNLIEANLTNANLRGANLKDANLSSANLTDAVFRKTHLPVDMTNQELSGANLSNVNLNGMNLIGVCLSKINKIFNTRISINNFFNQQGISSNNKKINFLLKKYDIGPSSNTKNDLEEALRCAALLGQKNDIHLLLTVFKVNPCAKNANGHTASYLAEIKGFTECVELLAEYSEPCHSPQVPNPFGVRNVN